MVVVDLGKTKKLRRAKRILDDSALLKFNQAVTQKIILTSNRLVKGMMIVPVREDDHSPIMDWAKKRLKIDIPREGDWINKKILEEYRRRSKAGTRRKKDPTLEDLSCFLIRNYNNNPISGLPWNPTEGKKQCYSSCGNVGCSCPNISLQKGVKDVLFVPIDWYTSEYSFWNTDFAINNPLKWVIFDPTANDLIRLPEDHPTYPNLIKTWGCGSTDKKYDNYRSIKKAPKDCFFIRVE